MKKGLFVFLTLALCLSMAACGGEKTPDEEKTHTCAGEQWVVKAEASCTAEGIKEHICSCGKVVATETIPLGTHSYVDGTCDSCGSMDPDYYPESFGLEFVDIGGGKLRLEGMGSCTDEIVVIPEYQGSFRVTEISKKAFLNNKKITAVIIPDSVTTIGEEAFRGCTALASVIIGDGVEMISKSAFSGCENLASVEMGSAVTTMGQAAFSDCDALTAIVIPKTVTKIESYAFSDCDGLTAVNIPGNAGLTLDSRLFFSCDSLRTVVIGNGITTIPNEMFMNCAGLVEVTLPDTLKEISIATFKGCSSLESITLPQGITKIWNEAFRDCTSLTEVVIPENVTKLGDGAFYGCSKLKKVTINATAVLEFKYQFEYCDSLEEIAIPENLAEQYADGWQFMSHVMQLPGGPGGPVSEGLLFTTNGNGTCYVSGRGSCTDTVIRIPDTSPEGDKVTAIGEGAFDNGCSDITAIIVPDTVTELGDHAFEGCYNLQSLDIPESVTTGKAYMLAENAQLTTLTLRCKNRLSWPMDVILRQEDIASRQITIYVPAELVEQYKTASGWSQFADKIQAIS